MRKRQIRHRRDPEFLYTVPTVRRNTAENARDVATQQEPTETLEETPPTNSTLSPAHSPLPQLNPAQTPQPDLQPPTPPNSPEIQEDLPQPTNVLPEESITHPVPTQNEQSNKNLDDLLNQIYTYKESPAAYSAAVQKFVDKNYSLSLHKQRRKKFRYGILLCNFSNIILYIVDDRLLYTTHTTRFKLICCFIIIRNIIHKIHITNIY